MTWAALYHVARVRPREERRGGLSTSALQPEARLKETRSRSKADPGPTASRKVICSQRSAAVTVASCHLQTTVSRGFWELQS